VNIIVSQNDKNSYHFRPDNTLTKGSGEYYQPASIECIEVAPALAIRIDRAAKGLSKQFAHRYISRYSYGLLIYPEAKEGYLYANNATQATAILQSTLKTTLDNTTYISEDFISIEEAGGAIISLAIDNQARQYKIPPVDLLKESIYELIERVTIHSSLKTGDLIFMELSPNRSTPDQAVLRIRAGSVISLSVEKSDILSIQIR